MPNPFGAPEISVNEMAQRCATDDTFVWLDVREPNEHALVSIADTRIHLLPLSRLAAERLDALPDVARVQDAPIVVMCHHGVRSAQVVAWLQQQGWTNVLNLAGGIDAWAREVDASIGVY
ncbi:MAG: rhodanese-like domain-containing protein [Caldilineaceae bacterium]